jgi:flagellar protein FliO/FliZ
MPDISLISIGIRTAATLFIVLGLLVLVLYILKRFVFVKHAWKNDAHLRVISSLHVGSKARIEIIEIEGQKILLGITPENITFLTKVPDIKSEYRQQERRGEDVALKSA